MADCCGKGDVLLLACSGGSNVGQIANDAARSLDQLGQGSMYCMVGIAAQLPSFVARTRKQGATIAGIDGCDVGCVKKSLAQIGVSPEAYVVVTDLGIAKDHHFNHTGEEVGLVAQSVVDALSGIQ